MSEFKASINDYYIMINNDHTNDLKMKHIKGKRNVGPFKTKNKENSSQIFLIVRF